MEHIHYGYLLWDLDPNRLWDIEFEDNFALELSPDKPSVWDSIIKFWASINDFNRVNILCGQASDRGIKPEEIKVCLAIDNE